MNSKPKFASLLSLILLGSLFATGPIYAKEGSVRDLVNSSQSTWNPFALLEQASHFPSFSNLGGTSGITMYEDEAHVVVEANLPGVDLESVDVTYDRGRLLIRAERESEKEGKDRSYYHKSMNSFAYNIEIPSNIDESKNPLADYKNGLMTIRFEKSEGSKPKKIEVQKK